MTGIQLEQWLTSKDQTQALTAFCVAARGSAAAGSAVLPPVPSTCPTMRTSSLAFVLPEVIEPVSQARSRPAAGWDTRGGSTWGTGGGWAAGLDFCSN